MHFNEERKTTRPEMQELIGAEIMVYLPTGTSEKCRFFAQGGNLLSRSKANPQLLHSDYTHKQQGQRTLVQINRS